MWSLTEPTATSRAACSLTFIFTPRRVQPSLISVLLSPTPLLSVLRPPSLYTSSYHDTRCLYSYSQRGMDERQTETHPAGATCFHLLACWHWTELRVCSSGHKTFFLLAFCADAVRDRTWPPTFQDDKRNSGWCYTMLRPVRSPPVSSDPAGYAKTTERQK